MAQENIAVTNNEAAQRYEASVDGLLSRLQYERRGDRIVYLHTEVPDALEDARARHLTVVPYCPFVRAYLQRHPEYLPLVDPAHRARLERTSAL